MQVLGTFAAALMAYALPVGSAPAQVKDKPEIEDLEKYYKPFEEACTKLFLSAVTGLTDARESQFMKVCASHPNKDVCEDTFAEVKKMKKVPSGLRCTGK